MNDYSGGPIGAYVLIGLGLQYVRNFLNLKTRLPAWNRIVGFYWVAGALFVGVSWTLPYLTSPWLWRTGLVLIGYTIYQLKDYRPARTLALALAPIVVTEVIEEIMSWAAPALHQSVKAIFDSSTGFSILWLITFLIIASRQKKTLLIEEQERQREAEQRRQIEARKAELEYLVAERTAEITQQKEELEQALAGLRQTQNQLIQSEKMASLGELTAGIAHEIQNPLNFVNNFSEVSVELIEELAEEQQKPERDADLEADLLADLKQNLEKITHHGNRAAAIVRGMLQHSRASSGQREPTDLNALTDEYLRLAYHGLRAKDKTFNASLRTEFDSSLGPVNVIPQDLGRVLLNLLTNAFYAVLQRQKRAEAGYQPEVTVRTGCADGQAVILIQDNGTGIPAELRRKIFQPFFTTKPTGEGTGLGLSLAYDIVTKGHGGALTVESQEGKGTQFRIELPT